MIKNKIPNEVKELYKNNSWRSRMYVNLRWRLRPFEKLEKNLPLSGIIIDIGCGYGLLANYLALKSTKRKVIGIDNSENRLKIARSTISNRSNITFINSDITNLNIPEIKEAVISDVLHHLSEEVSIKLLKQIYQKLNSNGKLVIEDVDNQPYWKYFSSVFIDNLLYFGQKINFKPANQWQMILEDIGFHVEKIPAHHGLFLADVILVCTKNNLGTQHYQHEL